MDSDAQSLAEQIAAMAHEPATPRDTQAHFLASLTEQFAAGQSETLYSLHTAGAGLRRQAEALKAAVEQLPAELHPVLKAQLAEIAHETSASALVAIEAAAASIDAATAALSTRLSQWKSTIDKAFDKRAGGLAVTVQEALQQLGDAAQDAGDQLTIQTKELSRGAQQFAADARASSEAMTAVGENVISRLIEVLDARDKADKALEDRLNARIDRLTKRTEATVNGLVSALAEQNDQARARLEVERSSTAAQLSELLDRLLAQPRGKLKDLRTEATKETKA